jgi:MYXO-CTERM domain-containing protein
MSFRRLSLLSLAPALALVSAPSIVSAEVLWRGDFETGDLTQWNSLLNPTKGDRKNINVVMTPVHGGTRAGEVVIHPDDLWEGNNHNRVELHYDAVDTRTAEGQTTYFSFFFRLPANAQTTNDIAYWETANSYQQSMAFWVEPGGGGTQLSFRTNHPSGMMHYNGPLTIEAWHQLAMQILWSENAGTGRVSVWLDGEKIVDDVAAKTKPDSNRVFVQVGYHRNATAAPVETIYLDDAIEATSLAEVLAPPGGNGGAGGSSGGGAGNPTAGNGGAGSSGAPSNGGKGGAGGTTGGVPSIAGTAGSTVGGGGGQAAAGRAGQGTGGASGASSGAGGSKALGGAPSGGSASSGAPSGTGGLTSGGRGGGAAAPVGGAAAVGGAISAPPTVDNDEGCSYGAVGKFTSAWPVALLAAGAALLRRRRR